MGAARTEPGAPSVTAAVCVHDRFSVKSAGGAGGVGRGHAFDLVVVVNEREGVNGDAAAFIHASE